MSDFLIEMGKKPWFRKVVKGTGVPIPTPLELKRPGFSPDPAPLKGRVLGVYSPEGSLLGKALAQHLGQAGARIFIEAGGSDWAGDAWTGTIRPTPFTAAAGGGEGANFAGLVFDGSAVTTVAELRALYAFIHPLIGQVEAHGRILLLGRRAPGDDAQRQALDMAIEGVGRSLAKEVGKKGITVNTLHVAPGAEGRLGPALDFFLGRASTYVTGQPLTLSPLLPEPAEAQTPPGQPLKGKVALVTGAAQGIGEATARVLAGQGAQVICLDRPEARDDLDALAQAIGGRVLTQDVTAGDAGARLTAFLAEEVGQVDIVVHNAGVTRDKTLAKMSGDQWDLVLAVNLEAIFSLTQALLDGHLKDGGRIVCVSSVSGLAGNVGQTNYAASKSGVLGYVHGLAADVAPRGIAVNAVAPGFIETRMTDAMPPMVREVARRMNALSQGGRPEDVAQAIGFLSGPGAAGITGQHLRVCGQSLVGS